LAQQLQPWIIIIIIITSIFKVAYKQQRHHETVTRFAGSGYTGIELNCTGIVIM